MRDLHEQLVSKLYAANLRMGLTNEQAIESARAAVEILGATLGGQRVYFPQNQTGREARDAKIRELASKGHTSTQISKRLCISDSRVRQIVSAR